MAMSLEQIEGSLSDDEIFLGKLTLKEVKKRIFWGDKLKPCSVSAANSPRECDNHDDSLKIIQTHSEPNLLSDMAKVKHEQETFEAITPGWDMREDDSFIKLENMVEKLCVSPTPSTKKTEQLNNTLEVIEYILNNPPSNVDAKPQIKSEIMTENPQENIDAPAADILREICFKKIENLSPKKKLVCEVKDSPEPPKNTPVKPEKKCARVAGYMTPVNTLPKSIFKTPAQPISAKKPTSSVKKSLSKTNAYQHISSPVASYIKNCPIVPLVKDIHPKKPLPAGPSSIPKLKSSVPIKTSNKENVNLPSVAYKSAKKTQVIDLPDELRLPQSQWANKIMTSLPRPVVIKHNHREQNFAKRKLLPQQEDSFADLSYHQAEVSVCTQKTAFKTNKQY